MYGTRHVKHKKSQHVKHVKTKYALSTSTDVH